MKLREMLKKTRLRVLGGEADKSKPIDVVDGLATDLAPTIAPNVAPGAAAPPNWVPSQQDDRPRH